MEHLEGKKVKTNTHIVLSDPSVEKMNFGEPPSVFFKGHLYLHGFGLHNIVHSIAVLISDIVLSIV